MRIKTVQYALVLLIIEMISSHEIISEDESEQLITESFSDQDINFSNFEVPTETVQYQLKQKFQYDQESVIRGTIVVKKNQKDGKIVGVKLIELQNQQWLDGLESKLKQKCQDDLLYFLEIEELNLLSSMPACYYYHTSGLNDTISFSTNAKGTSIIGMQIEYKDIKHLASFERNPKKKRLMQERQFVLNAGNVSLSTFMEGPSLIFQKQSYDSIGAEVKVQKQKVGGQEQDEQPKEQSFFQKYWIYIMLGFLVIQTLQGGAGADDSQPKRSPAQRK